MTERYFVEPPISADRVTLAGAEAHQLIHVMRAAPDMRVTLFDGSGDEFSAVVRQIGRADVELDILARESVDRELPFALTLGVALPKGDRQKWLVEKAVEIGVTRLVPLCTHRSVVQPTLQTILRLRRSVVEASKQCGRNRLMQIEEPKTWPDFIRDSADVPCRLLAHPGAISPTCAAVQEGDAGCLAAAGTAARAATAPTCHWPPSELSLAQCIVAVGPEGGFTEDEVSLATAAGWQGIDLGPRILRIETAAIALAAIVAARR
jgi:16S rRNA (uracil1498-N3)-methyltransferase